MGHAKLGGVEMKNLSTATPCTKHSIRKGEKLARHRRSATKYRAKWWLF